MRPWTVLPVVLLCLGCASGVAVSTQSSATPVPVKTAYATAPPTESAPPPPLAVGTPSAIATAIPSLTPTQRPVSPPRRASPTSSRHSWLRSDDGSVDTAVGYYSDCTGQSTPSRAQASIDTCVGGRTYVVGHNPGVFAGLLHMYPGQGFTYWNAAGTPQRLTVIARHNYGWYPGAPPPPDWGGAWQFQTCINASGTEDLILDLT